jgi:hypothetical protein
MSWADLYFLLLTCTYCIACSFKHLLLAAIISHLLKLIYSLYCLNFLVIKLRMIPIIIFLNPWKCKGNDKMFVKFFFIYIYMSEIGMMEYYIYPNIRQTHLFRILIHGKILLPSIFRSNNSFLISK